jgi:hypothetical protein
MNDDPLLSEVRAWLQDEDVALPDAEQAGREVRARLPGTHRRRGRWWPWASLGGSRSDPTPSPAPATGPAPGPAPVPAIHSHAPTIRWRTQSMLSPIRIIAVGALTLAVAGVVVVSRPFQQAEEPAPGAQASPAAAAPVAFTGTATTDTCVIPATTDADGPVAHTRGASCGPSYEFSDPRLAGTVTWLLNDDEYTDGSGLYIESVAMSIENDQGAWRMVPILSAKWPSGGSIADDPARHFFLVGEGAYDGLFAVVDGFRTDKLRGFIIDGALPPAPENAFTAQP